MSLEENKFEEHGLKSYDSKKKKKKKKNMDHRGWSVYHNNIQRSSSLYAAAIGREPVHYENTPMQKYSDFFT